MKKFLVLFSILLLAGFASANTTVNATITDGTGQLFALGTFQVDYIRPASNQGTIPTVNGVPIVEHGITGTLNSVGFFTVSLADINQVLPSGGQWEFTICPNASAQCSIIDTNSLVTGGSVDLSAFLSARVIAPVVSPSNINRAYKDSEVVSVTGTFYYDVVLNCIKFNNGSGWACVGTGGGGGGTPGTPSLSLQWNNAGTFAGTTDNNNLATTTYDSTTGRINPCNIDNVRYASCYNWTQTPGGSLTGGVLATVTLTPGPRGIDTTNSATFPYFLYVANTGTPEAVKITGGTCTTQGSTSCTIQFTPANSHSAGFTIQSATAGFAEAGLDALGTGSNSMQIKARPAGASIGNNTFVSIFYAPWYVRCGDCLIDGGGATLALNNKAGVIWLPSTAINTPVTIQNFRFLPMYPQQLGALITNTQCSAGVATIDSTLQPSIGDVVDIQFTNDPFYWGPQVVTGTGPTQWTFNKSCSVAKPSVPSVGMNNYLMTAIYDTGQDVRIHNIDVTFGGAPYDKFWNNGIVVVNDQHAVIDHPYMGGHFNCTATYCGQHIYAPGDFGIGPAVLEISNGSLNPGCSANGITAYNGNTVGLIHTIVQGAAMWAIRGGTQRGGFGGLISLNTYHEIGACTNPIFTPNQQTGVDWTGQDMSWFGGEGPQKLMPTFCTGGGTSYYYYLVVHDSVAGPSAPLYIGSSTPSSSTCTIKWPRAIDVNTTTYDILRSTDANNAPTTANCPGGSTSACGSRVLAQAQCNALQCNFVDDVTLNTSAYTVLMPDLPGSGVGGATNAPTFAYFPGGFVLEQGASLNYQGGNVGGNAVSSPGAVVATNGVGPVVTDSDIPKPPRTYIRTIPLKGPSAGSQMWKISDPSVSGGQPANSYGPIVIANPAKGTSGHSYGTGSYLITLATPKSDELNAANSPRQLTADPNDTGVALDVGGSDPALFGVAYTSPKSISNYIGTYADGFSWKERLSSTLKEFNTPTQFDLPMISSLGCQDCGPFNRTIAYTNDPLQTPPNLSGNWTTLLGTWTIGSGTAFPNGNYAYASVVTNEGGVNRAYAYYSGTSFTSDQIVQANMTPTNSIIGLCARMQNTTPITAYCFYSGGGTRNLVKFNAGTGTSLVVVGGPDIPQNSLIKLTVIGATITVFQNGVQIAQVNDTSITGGAPGMYVQNFAFSTQGIRNLYATSAGFTAPEGLTLTSLAPKTLVDGATISWNLGGFSFQDSTVTLGGNRTINISNPASGGNYTLRIVQDGTGGRTLTLGTGCTWKVVNGGGGAITLTAAANAIDILTFYYDGTNCYANLGTNYN